LIIRFCLIFLFGRCNNKYNLSEELILQVCEKILTVFHSYKTNTIKGYYQNFKENIDKLIHIYNLYNPPSNSNTLLISSAQQKLKEAEEPDISGGRKLYHRKRKSSRKRSLEETLNQLSESSDILGRNILNGDILRKND